MYYHGFDRDSLYLVPYMKRYFLETKFGFTFLLVMMAFACMLANILVFQDDLYAKIFSVIIFNLIFAGFVIGNWTCFQIFNLFNEDKDNNE